MQKQNNFQLGVFTLAMMSVAGIFTLRTLPLMAGYGLSAVFYYIVVALLFFIPGALVCAELATGWPKTGGLYIWIREAFGSRFGFLAIWLEWTNTVISFPATLAFIAATFAYAINPTLAQNRSYMVLFMLVLLWSTTLLNFLGIKFSSWFSNLGLIFGTMIPCFIIVSLAIYWIFSGDPLQIHFSWHNFLPHAGWHQSVFLIGLLLGYAGMQISAYHAQETRNPQRDYPKAILYAVIIILILSISGSLAISIVVPKNQINVISGLMQAITIFFATFHLQWLLSIIAILIVIGTLAMLNLWIIGPCKGLLATAQKGDLPKIMQKTNRYGAPTSLLISQGLVGSLFGLVYLLMPTINASYWVLVDLSALLTMMMYVMLFAAAIRLRYSHPNVERHYRIPGGKLGIWIVSGIGITVTSGAFFLGFVTPSQLKTGNKLFYETFLILGIVIVMIIPFLSKRAAVNPDITADENNAVKTA